jgi:hypothetical protein
MIRTKVHIWSILFYLSGVTGEILAAVASGDSDAYSIGMESWWDKNNIFFEKFKKKIFVFLILKRD